MKRKLVTLLLALCCTFSLYTFASCENGQNNDSSIAQTESVEESSSKESSSSNTETQTATYTRVDKDNTPNTEGEYILFGSYPQTKVTDDTLIDALNTQAGTLPTSTHLYDWTSYDYYIGTGTEESENNDTDFMWYQDETYNGEKYRGVYFTSYRPSITWKYSNKENSEQDDNGYTPSVVYWFAYEPIKWRILDKENTSAFILCEMLIDSQEFYHTSSFNEQMIYANNYASSNIRAWLNNNFYNTAFDSLQKRLIQVTTVDNSASTTSSTSNKYACKNTEDYIFLLNYQDISNAKYGFVADAMEKDTAKVKKNTDYAQCQGAYTKRIEPFGYAGYGAWWLRSPNSTYISTDYVGNDGSSDHLGYSVYSTKIGVCPALYIEL